MTDPEIVETLKNNLVLIGLLDLLTVSEKEELIDKLMARAKEAILGKVVEPAVIGPKDLIPVALPNLNSRIVKILDNAGIIRIEHLLSHSEKSLSEVYDMGPSSVLQVKQVLAEKDLSLSD